MSLSKTPYPLLSTGSTKEGLKNVDMDVKNQRQASCGKAIYTYRVVLIVLYINVLFQLTE